MIMAERSWDVLKKVRTHSQPDPQAALAAWTDGNEHRAPSVNSTPAAGRELRVVNIITDNW